jgi:hypothetical protein
VTRKDYEAIAKIIRCRIDQPDIYDTATVGSIATALTAYMAADNPRFNVGRFAVACGLGGSESRMER